MKLFSTLPSTAILLLIFVQNLCFHQLQAVSAAAAAAGTSDNDTGTIDGQNLSYNGKSAAHYHTLLIEETEKSLQKGRAVRDAAEYLLHIIDVGESFLCSDNNSEESEQACKVQVHKGTILAAINHNTFTQSLLRDGPVNTTHRMIPNHVDPKLKDDLLFHIENLHEYQNSKVENPYSMNSENGINNRDEDIVSSTMEIGIESTKQWTGISDNLESPFHTMLNDVVCINDDDEEALMKLQNALMKNSKSTNSDDINNNEQHHDRNLQIVIFGSTISFSTLFPIFLALIPLFDLGGFAWGLYASDSGGSLLSPLILAVVFSLVAPFQCAFDLLGCLEAVQSFFQTKEEGGFEENTEGLEAFHSFFTIDGEKSGSDGAGDDDFTEEYYD